MTLSRVLLALPLGLALAFAGPTHAQSEGGGALEEVKALEASYNEAMTAFRKLYQEASTDEERQKLYETDYPSSSDFARRFLALAHEHEGGEAAERALTWVITRAQGERELVKEALTQLAEHHLESEGLAGLVGSLQRAVTPESEGFLDAVLAKSPHAAVRGQACFALASVKKSQADLVRAVNADAEARENYSGYYGIDTVDRLLERTPEELLAEAEGYFERVQKEYGELAGRRGTLGDAAERMLFEIRNLAIGKVAPEIAGEDVGGVAFKLSDYRGKVVMLDFWGDW